MMHLTIVGVIILSGLFSQWALAGVGGRNCAL